MGILTRKSFKGRVQRVEYVLTKRGISLRPVIDSLHVWGARNKAHLERMFLERKTSASRNSAKSALAAIEAAGGPNRTRAE
jgi:DNA-binding HxlR family transcriptional regulator